MKPITKISLAAIAVICASAGTAHAACDVKHGTAANVIANNSLGHLESDCASAADVAAQGIAITTLQTDVGTLQTTAIDHEGRIVSLETNDAAQDVTLTGHTSAITALQSENAAQQTELDDHEARITTGEAKNVEQDGRLNGHDTAIADHETRITANTAKNVEQDGRLDGHDTAIGSLETVTAGHEMRLDAHDALLSQHSATLANHGKRLDEQEKGLAIAMAMPDAWLSDKKNFGIFGSVGGFNDETAVGFAAIGRLDQTWSLNAKFGSDTEFKQFGWQVGAGAQW